MSRIVRLPTDDVARLRRLLGMIETATTPEERAAFVPEPPEPKPPDPFAFRRMMAVIEEREARRLARKTRRRLRLVEPVPVIDGFWAGDSGEGT